MPRKYNKIKEKFQLQKEKVLMTLDPNLMMMPGMRMKEMAKRQLKMEDRVRIKLMTFFCVTLKLFIFPPSFFLHNSNLSSS